MSARGITVGVDGSPASDAALVYALDEASARRTSVVAVTAWWTGPCFPEDRQQTMDEHRSAASLTQDLAIRRAVAEVDGQPTIERRLVHGDPGVVLVEEARSSVHLVVGCAHKNLYRRVTEGSVSAQCVRNSSVPVTVVPWPAQTTEPEPARAHGAARPMAEIDA